jgi:D-glycero-alpha-D-manno-heptose-7-phosphate kinase
MIISKTPFRVSLFGGGSDHPQWFNEYGGRVISLAINRYCYLTTRILPPFFDHDFRIAYSRVETVKNFIDIQHPVVRESIKKYAPELKLEVHHDGDLPARSGIGSSSAFTVGMIHSLLSLKNIEVSKIQLADFAIRMESQILQENVGWQDQIACSVGGLNLIEFSSRNHWRFEPLVLSREFENEICSRMVLVFTGVSRNSHDIQSGLVNSLRNKRKQIQRVMELATICKGIFDKSGNLDQIGEMLNESWNLKKAANALATNSSLDSWYERGKAAGAIGGKVLGAGGGGFFLFWIKKDGRDEFLSKFGSAIVVPFAICHSGSTIIYENKDVGVTRYA